MIICSNDVGICIIHVYGVIHELIVDSPSGYNLMELESIYDHIVVALIALIIAYDGIIALHIDKAVRIVRPTDSLAVKCAIFHNSSDCSFLNINMFSSDMRAESNIAYGVVVVS